MRIKVARLLVGLYPRSWRERYGEEFGALLDAEGGGIRKSANVVWWAIREHVSPSCGRNRGGRSFGAMVRKPSALVPLGMSLTALTLVLVHLVLYGIARERDEGTTAHLWQLLMAGQMPVLAWFAIRWLPRAPRQTLCVMALQAMALQAMAVLASMAPVFFLNL